MLKKMLRSIGVGNADVDIQLNGDTFMPGGWVTGTVLLRGGKGAQEFGRIYLSVVTWYKHEDTTHQYALVKGDVSGPFVLQPGEQRSLPVNFPLPPDTPLTLGRVTRVAVRTGLDVPGGVDPSDSDPIRVVPNPPQQAVLEAFNRLGFHLREVENEYNPRLGAPHTFVQEFEFVPAGGRYRGRFDEVELVFKATPDGGYDLLLEVDRRARGLGGFLRRRWALTNGAPACTWARRTRWRSTVRSPGRWTRTRIERPPRPQPPRRCLPRRSRFTDGGLASLRRHRRVPG